MSVSGCMSPAHLNQLKAFLKEGERVEDEGGAAVGWEEGGGTLAGDNEELSFPPGGIVTSARECQLMTAGFKVSLWHIIL